MKILRFFAKLFFSIPLILFGLGHLSNANMMTRMIPEYLPFPIFWVYLSGVSLILGGLSIISGQKTKLAGILLGLLLLTFAFMIHLPNILGDSEPNALSQFLKDLSLAGAAFYFASHNENKGFLS